MMKRLLLLMLLSGPVFAGAKYDFKDSKLNDEFDNNYKEHSFPNWVNARGSSATITYINVSTITVNGVNVTGGGPGLASTQTWSGANTYTGALVASTGTITSFMVVGTTQANNAAAGRIGEHVSSVTGLVAAGANGAYQDLTTISLTAGDWLVIGQLYWNPLANTTLAEYGISIGTAGNAFSDNVVYDNRLDVNFVSGIANFSGVVIWRLSTASTVTVRLKNLFLYTGSTPNTGGKLEAWRTR